MIHPDTEVRKINDEIGSGVFATKLIPRGSITWALDHFDHVLTDKQVAALPKAYLPIVERYAFRDGKGDHVLCWDHGRFVNHSCAATSLPLGSICEVAVRDIQPGEQITSDYVTLNLEQALTCHCGAPTCRGVMRPEDLPRYTAAIDEAIKLVASQLDKVRQPILDYMLAPDQERFIAIAAARAEPPSCLEVIGGR